MFMFTRYFRVGAHFCFFWCRSGIQTIAIYHFAMKFQNDFTKPTPNDCLIEDRYHLLGNKELTKKMHQTIDCFL